MSQSRHSRFLLCTAISTVLGTAVAISAVALAEAIWPQWDAALAVPFCAFAFALGSISRGFAAPIGASRRTLVVAAAQLSAMLILVTAWVDVIQGQPLFNNGIPHIERVTWTLVAPMVVAWMIAHDFARLFLRVGEPAESHAGYVPPIIRVARRLVWGGLLLAIVAALTQPNVAHLLKIPTAASPGPTLNVIVYFALSLGVLGQMRYTTLHQHWRDLDISVVMGLQWRWAGYCVLVIGVVTTLALVVPAYPVGGTMVVARHATDKTLIFTFQTFSILRQPIIQLLTHFGGTSQVVHTKIDLKHLTPPPGITLPHLGAHVQHRAPHHHRGGATGGGFPHEAVLFWIAICLTLVYFVRRMARRFPSHVDGAWENHRERLQRFWWAIRQRLREYVEVAQRHMPQKMAQALQVSRVTGLSVNVDALTPRQQVLHYYQATTRSAEKHGAVLRPSSTPREFAGMLTRQAPDTENDVSHLVEAFEEARYSRHAIDGGRALRARGNWQAIRAALGRSRRA